MIIVKIAVKVFVILIIMMLCAIYGPKMLSRQT